MEKTSFMGKLEKAAKSLIEGLHLRQTGPLALSSVLGQAIMFFSLPVLLRIYGPEAYGEYSVIISIVNVLLMVATLKLDVVIPTMRHASLAARLASALLALAFAVALAVVPMGLTLNWLTGWKPGHSMNVSAVLAIMAVLLAVDSGFVILRAWLVRLQAFGGVAAMQITRPVVLVAGGVAMGLAWPDWAEESGAPLLLAAIAAGVAMVAAGYLAMPRAMQRHLQPWRWRRIRQEIRANSRFLSAMSLAQILNQINTQLPLWGVAIIYGPREAGWVALAIRIVMFPAMVAGSSLGSVLSRELSRRHHEGESIVGRVRATQKLLVLIGVLGYTALVELVPFATAVLFGDKWTGATTTIQIMSLLGLGYFINSATMFVPILRKEGQFLLRWNVARLMASLFATIYAYIVSLSYTDLLGLISAIFFISQLIFAFHCTLQNGARQ